MYFFDTYALFEIINGNSGYEKYKQYPFVICILNVAEFYNGLLKDKGKKEADEIYNNFDFDILDITETLIMEAVGFRHQYKKDDVSLSDAVGYLLARKYGLKFLTGDKFFENRDNVEFVK